MSGILRAIGVIVPDKVAELVCSPPGVVELGPGDRYEVTAVGDVQVSIVPIRNIEMIEQR